MYEDVVKKLRYCGNAISCLHCPYWEGCGGSKEDLSKAADAIEELSYKYKKALSDLVKGSKSNWIPVTERLPKVGEIVIVYTHKSAVTNRRVWIDCMITSSRNPSPRWAGHNSCVLLWMPLPEPPKEET